MRLPFPGMRTLHADGIFLRVKDECHLVVSITLLQRAVSVVTEKDALVRELKIADLLKPTFPHLPFTFG